MGKAVIWRSGTGSGTFPCTDNDVLENGCDIEEEEIGNFLNEYLKCVGARFDITGLKERTKVFMEITCLRGITWCAMAWVQYQQPDKLIINESTYQAGGLSE